LGNVLIRTERESVTRSNFARQEAIRLTVNVLQNPGIAAGHRPALRKIAVQIIAGGWHTATTLFHISSGAWRLP